MPAPRPASTASEVETSSAVTPIAVMTPPTMADRRNIAPKATTTPVKIAPPETPPRASMTVRPLYVVVSVLEPNMGPPLGRQILPLGFPARPLPNPRGPFQETRIRYLVI